MDPYTSIFNTDTYSSSSEQMGKLRLEEAKAVCTSARRELQTTFQGHHYSALLILDSQEELFMQKFHSSFQPL